MRKLTLADVEDARWGHGRSALLFITDRCPVGCAHCSVDSRPDSPRISDFALFTDIVNVLAEADLQMVGISGGEPFVERKALPYAVSTLADAGKDVVVYTSGFWAVRDRPASWISDVIRRCGCVFLSTDSFHEAELASARFVSAARAIAAQDVPIICQVINLDPMPRRAEELLVAAFGDQWQSHAEMSLVPPLPYGRARDLFARSGRRTGDSFGACQLAKAPVIRYDGLVTGCCNESVLLGGGPAWLRRRARSGGELSAALAEFRASPMLRTIAEVGVSSLTRHPRAGDAGSREYSSICGACWLTVSRLADQPEDRLITAMAALGRPAR